jgi:hypothetical protein
MEEQLDDKLERKEKTAMHFYAHSNLPIEEEVPFEFVEASDGFTTIVADGGDVTTFLYGFTSCKINRPLSFAPASSVKNSHNLH